MKNKFRTVGGRDKCGRRRDEWRSPGPIIDIAALLGAPRARDDAICFFALTSSDVVSQVGRSK